MIKEKKSNDIIFSIVIPIYNAENVLERTIQSVLNQSCKNYELWLIDDCSTDGSFRIAQKYDNLYSQVHAYRMSANSGSAQKPIVTGFDMAKGDFVMVIGNDDEINDVFLEKMHKIVKNNSKVDIVVPSMKVVNATLGEQIGAYPRIGFDMSSIITGPEACRMVIPHWQFATNGMIIRRNLVGYLRDENPYTYSNSDELTSRILLYHARNVAFSKESVYNYYQYHTSITHKRSVKLFETLFTDTHLVAFTETHYDEELESAMCASMLSHMICLYKEYRAESRYTIEERNRINEIFRETYSFLQSKKQYLQSMKSRFYLSNWHVFTFVCKAMMLAKK